MSNHFSADKLKFPGDDRRLDLTDLFVFQAPDGRASPRLRTVTTRVDRADHGLEPDQRPAADPGPGDRPGVLPRRGLPDQHRH